MSGQAPGAAAAAVEFNQRLAVLLSMAMFVLVVDTSLMNVSISAVVTDLGTTVSGVQSAIALEALVSAAFILISSKVGDLIGRKRAYVLGLLGYAVGALAMVLAQTLCRSSSSGPSAADSARPCCCPRCSRSSTATSREPPRSGSTRWSAPPPRSPRPSGRSLGGFITTFLSWRVGFLLELVVIGGGAVRHPAWSGTSPYTGPRGIDLVGAVLSVLGMGGIVLGILVWEEGGAAVGALLAIGAVSLVLLAWWLVRRKRDGAS